MSPIIGGVTAVVCAIMFLSSCGGSGGAASGLSRHADDVARGLGITASQADGLISSTARQLGSDDAAAAERILQDADVIAARRSTLASIIDGIETRVSQVDIDEVIVGTFCSEFQKARLTGVPPTVSGFLNSLITSVGQTYANAILRTGNIHRFVNAVSTLMSDDPEGISVLVAREVYC